MIETLIREVWKRELDAHANATFRNRRPIISFGVRSLRSHNLANDLTEDAPNFLWPRLCCSENDGSAHSKDELFAPAVLISISVGHFSGFRITHFNRIPSWKPRSQGPGQDEQHQLPSPPRSFKKYTPTAHHTSTSDAQAAVVHLWSDSLGTEDLWSDSSS